MSMPLHSIKECPRQIIEHYLYKTVNDFRERSFNADRIHQIGKYARLRIWILNLKPSVGHHLRQPSNIKHLPSVLWERWRIIITFLYCTIYTGCKERWLHTLGGESWHPNQIKGLHKHGSNFLSFSRYRVYSLEPKIDPCNDKIIK